MQNLITWLRNPVRLVEIPHPVGRISALLTDGKWKYLQRPIPEDLVWRDGPLETAIPEIPISTPGFWMLVLGKEGYREHYRRILLPEHLNQKNLTPLRVLFRGFIG